MKLTRIYASADGESHIEEIDLPVETPGERAVTAFVPALQTGFSVVSVSGAQDWHPAPRRQLVTVLSGALEIECSDGSARRFGPGESFIADDLRGRGHVTRYPAGPVRLHYVHLPDGFDFGRWTAGP
ncbi:MAG TPA: hypothetical protein VNN21_00480 [Dehalococcoidia bacterium]|nr:hypothetical protein [Dehalococcoidia bacterium]